jgi:hypothetical protein
MIDRSVEELLETVLNSENEVWRDDAAEELAKVSDRAKAEAALLAAIKSPKLDDSLRATCADSLATIWIETGHVSQDVMKSLTGEPRKIVEAFLRKAGMLL